MADENRIQAVIFDRDGVLTYFDIESLSVYLRALLPISPYELMHRWEQWGEQVGFPRSLSEEARFLGGFWDHISLSYGLTDQQSLELHRIDYTDFIRAFPDAIPAMRTVRQRGLRVGVLSNFSLASLDSSLTAAGFGGLIDSACAATVIGASKPALEAYQIVAKRLQVAPKNCLFLDDEPICVDGARSAGMQAFLVQRSTLIDVGDVTKTDVVSDLSALGRILRGETTA